MGNLLLFLRPERLDMESVIYEFGEIPVVLEGFTIYPSSDLIKETGSRDVSVWINWLYDDLRSGLEDYEEMGIDFTIILWNTGLGSWVVR